MFWLELALIVVGGSAIAVTLFPFSPMTLKAYMPGRSAMIGIHRNRLWLRAVGLALLAALAILVIAGESSSGWWWALGGVVGFSGLFFWSGYVPVIMRPPPRQIERTATEGDSELAPDEDVLGIEIGGERRAYVRTELARPHVAFDTIGGTDVAITYCILCNTAVGFEAELHGDPMRFRAISAFNNNIIYHDSDRGNYIQQLDGGVVAGPDTGEELAPVPIAITSWQAWRKAHPDTALVRLPPTGIRDKMMSSMLDWMIPLPGLARRTKPWHPVHGKLDSRLPAMSMVVGVENGDEQRAFPLGGLQQKRVVNDDIGGEPIVVVYDPAGDTVGVFSRRLGDEVLSFHAGGDGVVVDDQTERSWAVDGAERSEGRPGKRLEPYPHFAKLFWFSWALFKPETEIAAL
ncbi:MAG: DUF3179 domain-containing (seleno)protein [Acidimicrobiia bacterium]